MAGHLVTYRSDLLVLLPYRDVIIPHPQKRIISFAIPHPICTPFNNYYYPIRTNPQGQTTPDVDPDLTIASSHAYKLLLQKILIIGWDVALCI